MHINGQLKGAQVEAVTDTAARPSAGSKGRILYDIALGQLIYDNGSAWVVLPKQSDTYTKTEIDTALTSSTRVIYEEKLMASDKDLTNTAAYITEFDNSTFPNTGLYRITTDFNIFIDGNDGGYAAGLLNYLEFYITNAADDARVQLDQSDGDTLTLGTTISDFADVRMEYLILNAGMSFLIDLSDSAYSGVLVGGCRFRVKANHSGSTKGATIRKGSSVRIEKLPNHLSYADNSNSWT